MVLAHLVWISRVLGFFLEQQTGLRSRRCTADCIRDVISALEQARSEGETVLLVLLDVQSAFDGLPGGDARPPCTGCVWTHGALRACLPVWPLFSRTCAQCTELPATGHGRRASGIRVEPFSKLSKDSQLLPAFMSLLEGSVFKRCPFSISSAPKHFQRRMNQVVEVMPGMNAVSHGYLGYRTTASRTRQAARGCAASCRASSWLQACH